MKNKLLVFCMLPMYMQAHVPGLHVINGTQKEIAITPIRTEYSKKALYFRGYGIASGEAFTFPSAKGIETIVINGKSVPGLRNLDQDGTYQRLVQEAEDTKQNLCLTVKSMEPGSIATGIFLCAPEAPELYLPRILIKNNNWLWGDLVNIKVANVPGADRAPIAVQALIPKQVRLLTQVSSAQDYYLWAHTSFGKLEGFVIAEETLKEAQEYRSDLLVELTIGWAGTINIKEKFVSPIKAAELLEPLQTQKQSGLMKLRTRIAGLFGFSGKK